METINVDHLPPQIDAILGKLVHVLQTESPNDAVATFGIFELFLFAACIFTEEEYHFSINYISKIRKERIQERRTSLLEDESRNAEEVKNE